MSSGPMQSSPPPHYSPRTPGTPSTQQPHRYPLPPAITLLLFLKHAGVQMPQACQGCEAHQVRQPKGSLPGIRGHCDEQFQALQLGQL